MWSRAAMRACSAASVAVSPRVPPWKCSRGASPIWSACPPTRFGCHRSSTASSPAWYRYSAAERVSTTTTKTGRRCLSARTTGATHAPTCHLTSVGMGAGTGPWSRIPSSVTKPIHPGEPMADGIASSADRSNCLQRSKLSRLAVGCETAEARASSSALRKACRHARRRAGSGAAPSMYTLSTGVARSSRVRRPSWSSVSSTFAVFMALSRRAGARFVTTARFPGAWRRVEVPLAAGVRRKRIEQWVPRRILSATLPTSRRDAPRP